VVDDDPRMRDLIRDILSDSDCEIVEGGDGREALQLYRRHHPDWVIMDVEIAPPDGIAATRSILDEDPAGRVVILTKHDSRQFREDATAAGARAYLPKDRLTELKSLLGSLNAQDPKP